MHYFLLEASSSSYWRPGSTPLLFGSAMVVLVKRIFVLRKTFYLDLAGKSSVKLKCNKYREWQSYKNIVDILSLFFVFWLFFVCGHSLKRFLIILFLFFFLLAFRYNR